jgi:hypothetical protein
MPRATRSLGSLKVGAITAALAYGEILLYLSYGPAPDYNPADPATQRDAVRFAETIAGKI